MSLVLVEAGENISIAVGAVCSMQGKLWLWWLKKSP